MASTETRKVTIEIITSEESKKSKNDTKPKAKDKEGKINRSEFDKLESVLINQAYNQAKSLVKQSVNSTLSRYYNMKEDYMLENNVSAIRNVINKTSSFATTISGGAMVGGIAGGIIAGAGWLISEGINVSNRWKDIYAEINATNYNKAFTKARLGLVDGGRGTEN